MIPLSQCERCKHYDNQSHFYCDAFPDGKGIPAKLLNNTIDHRKPYEGDHGIRFEQQDPLNAILNAPIETVKVAISEDVFSASD